MVDVESPGIAQAQPSIRWPQPWCLAPPPARAVELSVAKNRHGDTGTLSLIVRSELGTMREEARV